MARTVTFLADTEKTIASIRDFLEELLPVHSATLRKTIRITKKSVNSLLTVHLSLQHKITYAQQKRALARQKAVLAEVDRQQTLWASLLKIVKDEEKQLKRLHRVQREYEVVSESPDCDEECKARLEDKISFAPDRSVRAQQAHGGTLEQLRANIARIQDEGDSHQKQVELDEKAMERAKEAVRLRQIKLDTREMMSCEKLEKERMKEDEWLPDQYKSTAKKENERQALQAQEKRKARR